MPKENTTKPSPSTENAGADKSAPCSPFNYSVNEEVEREKAMKRATDRVPNDPSRPIL